MTEQRLDPPSATQLPRWKRALFLAIPVIVATCVGFLVVELYVRATRSSLDLLALTGRKIAPHPMAAWAQVDGFSAFRGRPARYEDKTFNRHGFVSTPELTVSKPEGTIRIVFLGGSSTAGMGKDLADQKTWPWQAAEMVQRNLPSANVEFINGALAGYTSFESYGRLWSRIRFFSPDIIVVNHAWNEMYYFTHGEVDNIASWRTLSDGSWTLDRTDRALAVYEPRVIDHLIRWSQALVRLRLLVSEKPPGEVRRRFADTLATDYDGRGLEIWRTNLRLIREAAMIMGAELFVMKQPTLIVAGMSDCPNLSPQEERRCWYEFHGFDHAAHVEAFQQIYQVIDEEIDPEHIIDATDMSGRPEYFYDHIHPTEMGAIKLAEIASQDVVASLR
jgi:lysophospholipase L1-like esterase